MMRGPGRGYGEGAQQIAGIILFVLLLLFFALAARLEWDRRHGVPVPSWSEVLSRRSTGLMRGIPARRQVRENEVI